MGKNNFVEELTFNHGDANKAIDEFIEKIGAKRINNKGFLYKDEKWFIDEHPFSHSHDIIVDAKIAPQYDNFLLIKVGSDKIQIPGWTDKKEMMKIPPRDIYRNGGNYYAVMYTNINDLTKFRILEEEKKVLQMDFSINKEKAEELGRNEMTSGILAGLHSFAKQAGIFFKDINAKDECILGDKKIKIYTRDAMSDEDMLVYESYFSNHPEINYYVLCKIKGGFYDYLGFVTKEKVSETRKIKMFGQDSSSVSDDIRRIFSDQYEHMSKIIPIYVREEKQEKEKIVLQNYVPLHVHSEYCIYGQSYIKSPEGIFRLSKLYQMQENGEDLPEIYNENGKSEQPKRIFNMGRNKTYEIITEDNKKIIATENHKFLTNRGWIELKNLKEGDKLISVDISKEISERQKKKFEDGSLNKFLEGGRKTRYAKGCKPVSPFKKGIKPWNCGKSIRYKIIKKPNKKEKIALLSMQEKKKSWWRNAKKSEKEKIMRNLKAFEKGHVPHNKGKKDWGKKLHEKYPEIHPNHILNKNGNVSYRQRELYEIIKKKYKDAVINYRVTTKKGFRFLDVAIPELKIDFEYDGEYWHTDRKKDLCRDCELEEIGWKTIRINKNNFKKFKEEFGCTLKSLR